jgi:hypothetical protein
VVSSFTSGCLVLGMEGFDIGVGGVSGMLMKLSVDVVENALDP